MELKDAVNAALAELSGATNKFGPFASDHEGYAVILEELEEMWDEIKLYRMGYDRDNLKKEAIQVAAMALRFLVDRIE